MGLSKLDSGVEDGVEARHVRYIGRVGERRQVGEVHQPPLLPRTAWFITRGSLPSCSLNPLVQNTCFYF